MRYSKPRRPRRTTDDQIRRLLEWKPLKDLARELGISESWARAIRAGHVFKVPSP